MFIKQLDMRGSMFETLCTRNTEGYVFHCVASPIAGFIVYNIEMEKTNIQSNGDCTSFDIFVPFGKTALLYWKEQHVVSVICTVHGVLEIASEWIGGDQCCFSGEYVYPSGVTYRVPNGGKLNIVPHDRVMKAWEKYFEKNMVIGTPYVELKKI
jgi:hypothetical protein